MHKLITATIIATAIAQAAHGGQVVKAQCSQDTAQIIYGATDATLVGVGFTVHYNSDDADFLGMSRIMKRNVLGIQGPEDDTDDYDNDMRTDKYFRMAWSDWDMPTTWPGTVPVMLARIHFDAGGYSPLINVVGVSNAPGHELFVENCE